MSRRTRSLALIGAAALTIVAAGFMYLGGKLPTLSAPATAARPTPVATSEPASSGGSCAPTQMKFSGAFNECAAVDKGLNCPSGSFNQAKTFRMHGTKNDFILYVEVDGGYHGPGTYALQPWPHDSLGVPDGIAKVAVRDVATGRLWESSAGSLTIDALENSGYVFAGLGASQNSPVVVDLSIAGWWSCS